MSGKDWISTRDHASGPFAPHGEFRISLRGDVFLYEARGPFNREAVQALAPVRRLAYERWGASGRPVWALVRWFDSAMMSPDTFRAFATSFQVFADTPNPLRAVAWVAAPEVEGVSMMAPHFEALYGAAGLSFALFEDEAVAMQWLQSLGAEGLRGT